MKLPKAFVPEKDLEKKVKELNKSLSEVVLTVEEFKHNNMEAFYCNIDAKKKSKQHSEKAKQKIEDRAINKILKDTYKGLIKWKQDPEDIEKYTAHATVLNANDKKITIPITFRTSDYFYHGVRFGSLHLGDQYCPCKDTQSPEIKKLVSDYFKINLAKRKEYNNETP